MLLFLFFLPEFAYASWWLATGINMCYGRGLGDLGDLAWLCFLVNRHGNDSTFVIDCICLFLIAAWFYEKENEKANIF